MRKKFLSLCVGASLTSLSFAEQKQMDIIGGEFSDLQKRPYVVSLQRANRHYCGGTLIRENLVLTAGHCVDRLEASDIKVVINSQTRSQNDPQAEVIQATRINIHPNYFITRNYISHDFALLTLERASRIQPVELIAGENDPFQIANGQSLALGWGTTTEQGSLSSTLLELKLPLVNADLCSVAYPDILNDSMLCAGFPEGQRDTCQGDSGGPLISTNAEGREIQIGVVSWGEGCARPGRYGVYGDLAYAANWLRDQTP